MTALRKTFIAAAAGVVLLAPFAAVQAKKPAAPAAAATLAQTQGVTVDNAWARATVAGQKASGAFFTVRSAQADVALVAAHTPLAGTTELHEMRMEGDVMRMKAIARIPVPMGQTVTLAPGGLHVMFFQLQKPLSAGSKLPLTLVFEDAKGQRTQLQLDVPVAQTNPAAKPADSAPATPHAGAVEGTRNHRK